MSAEWSIVLEETEAEDTFRPSPGVRFVSVFLVDRAYGGPEEGGWYFDTGELLECHAVPAAEAAELADRKAVEFSNEGRRDISSVLSEGQYRILISERPGRSYPDQAPRYE